MDAAPVGGDGATPDGKVLHTTVALNGDGTVIAQARHLAADFLTRIQGEHGVPVSQRAMELTQLVVSELVTNSRNQRPRPGPAGSAHPRRPDRGRGVGLRPDPAPRPDR